VEVLRSPLASPPDHAATRPGPRTSKLASDSPGVIAAMEGTWQAENRLSSPVWVAQASWVAQVVP